MNAVEDLRRDVRETLEERYAKLKKYRAHDMRSVVQERRVAEIYQEVRVDQTRTKEVLLMEFKMKFHFYFTGRVA